VLVEQVDGLNAQALERCINHAADLFQAAAQPDGGCGPFWRSCLKPNLAAITTSPRHSSSATPTWAYWERILNQSNSKYRSKRYITRIAPRPDLLI
jgi:hypothetical protein